MSRLGIRHRLLVVVVATVAAALAAMIVGFNLLLAHNLAGDADRLLRARSTSELGLLAVRQGRLVIGEAPDEAAPDTYAWVYSRGRTLESPPSSSRLVAQAARRLATRAPRYLDVASADTRLYAVPVVVGGRRFGTVVAALSLRPYEQTRSTALYASLGLGGAVLLLVALAARWLLASSLRPVARMTRLAAAWSERDLDRRFAAGDPHDELTELAATLDGLLDRLAASLRRERRFSAELSHELRTPLSSVIAETELALMRPRAPDEYRAALELVHANAQQLSRTIDALVAAARHEAGTVRGTADAFAVAAAAVDACAGLAAERDVAVDVGRPERPIRLGVEGDLAERVLQPVVENACRYGRGRVSVSIARGGDGVVYRVADDGPGVGDDEREQIFEPGARGGVGQTNGGGAGLGLALARRLARSVTGDVEAVAEAGGVFLVRLPAG
jgi:signal transduction histidine kinase